MRKYIVLFLLISFSVLINKEDNFSLGVRYIKLGNTYREGKNFDFAARFLNDGINIVSKSKDFEGKYWTATAYEYLGYLYRDMGMQDESKRHFDKSVSYYKQIIRQQDGSQYAMIDVINGLSRSQNGANSVETKGNSGLVLNFASSKLKEIPAGIPNNVQSLVLRDNKFRAFPESLINFVNLEYLDLSGNRIKTIPESVTLLKKLHYLDLSSNKISELPVALSQMTELRELNLSKNKLKKIPAEICNLKNLKILNLKGNKLDFEEVLNLVRCLQNTNIIFDEYQRVDEEETLTGGEELE